MADPLIPTPDQDPAPSARSRRTGGSLRASDADRERVAEVVRGAAVDGRLDMAELDERLGAVYAARTYGELAETTTDLPDAATGSIVEARTSRTAVPSERPRGPAVVAGPASGAAIAVFSGTNRTGHWTVPEQLTAVAVMGGVQLDLRRADLAAREVVITVFALFGGIEIVVPDGLTVRADGIGIFGGFDSDGAADAGPDAPVVVIRGAAVFGSVEVKRKVLKPARRDRGRLDGGDSHP